MTDRIEVRGIRAFGRHGANPGEKDVPQPFDIDVFLDVDIAAARTSDALADTVNYAAVHATVLRLMRERSDDLLERLGQAMLDELFVDRRIHAARIRIAKPGLLAGASPVVELSATRP